MNKKLFIRAPMEFAPFLPYHPHDLLRSMTVSGFEKADYLFCHLFSLRKLMELSNLLNNSFFINYNAYEFKAVSNPQAYSAL